MTLVVAKRIQNVILVVADTKLTDSNGAKWNGADQSNKIFCIRDQWTIAYAGNTQFADALFKAMPPDPSFSELKQLIFAAHRDSLDHEPTDFLLVSVQSLSIHLFTDGTHKKQLGSTAWLGDIQAFSSFQSRFIPMRDHKPPNDVKISFEPGSRGVRAAIVNADVDRLETCMSAALRDVTQDPSIDSVGGVPITLVIGKGRQQFWPGLSGLFASPNPAILPSPDRDILFGQAQTGDFNYEIIAPAAADSNTLAVFYPNANFALLFARWDQGLPFARTLKDVSSDTILARIADFVSQEMWRIKIKKRGHVYEIDTNAPRSAQPLLQR